MKDKTTNKLSFLCAVKENHGSVFIFIAIHVLLRFMYKKSIVHKHNVHTIKSKESKDYEIVEKKVYF